MRGKYKSPRGSLATASRLSPDGVGSGKSNVWFPKDREDIYHRRNNGEEWETICKDYPNRTRHAMQQQYSVMRKQYAGDNPSATPSRRGGRRRRGVGRGTKWAAINRPRPGSTDEDLDSDLPLEMELGDDDEEEDEYQGMPLLESDLPDDDERMAENDMPSPSPPPPAPIEETPEHFAPEDALYMPKSSGTTKRLGRGGKPKQLRRQSVLKESKRLTGQSEPRCARTMKKAVFPNLSSRSANPIDSAPLNSEPYSIDSEPIEPVALDPKPAHREASKRRADADDTELESRSSSHLSKQRKYSTEPSETFNVGPADSAASLRLLNGFKSPGGFFSAEVVAKAQEDWKSMSAAYESEKSSRKETYEAALRRATRRANDAEHKLQDASQRYADDLKVEVETHSKALEAKERELEAKTKELEAKTLALESSEKAMQLENEKSSTMATASVDELTSQLAAKESQLTLSDSLRAQTTTQLAETTTQLAALASLHTTALSKTADLESQHSNLTTLIEAFEKEDFNDVGVGKIFSTVKNYGREIGEGNREVGRKLEGESGWWRRVGEAVGALSAQFGGEHGERDGGEAEAEAQTEDAETEKQWERPGGSMYGPSPWRQDRSM